MPGAEFVQQGKAEFAAKAAKNMAYLKIVKAGGVILNVAAIALPAVDIIRKKEINGDNGSDFAAGVIGVTISGSWLISPMLWIQKKVNNLILPQQHNFVDSPVKSSEKKPSKL